MHFGFLLAQISFSTCVTVLTSQLLDSSIIWTDDLIANRIQIFDNFAILL
jgi:uncharacterized membrane protein